MTQTASHPQPGASEVSAQAAVMRLTAVWAFVESGLGGILHAFKLPFTGLIIGGTAVILITLIAHFAKRPREILGATLLVLIVKALVSPHSPVGAYVAVSFQGVLGFAIYSVSIAGSWSTILFALLAMLESAIQKLLMLTLFFGKPLWNAIDQWGNSAIATLFPSRTGQDLSLSWGLIAIYLGIYLVGGLGIGWIARKMPDELAAEQQRLRDEGLLDEALVAEEESALTPARKKGKKYKRIGLWLIVTFVLACSIYWGNQELSAGASAAVYVARTLAILAIWYLLVGPLLTRFIRNYLLGKRGDRAADVQAILDSLPQLKTAARTEYARLSKQYSGWQLYRRWLLRLLAVSLA